MKLGGSKNKSRIWNPRWMASREANQDIAILKRGVNEKLRDLDIQLQEFRTAISFQNGVNVNDQI